MSWSIAVIGRPQNVCDELDRHGEGLTGQSQAEFLEAKPHLQALVRENFARGAGYLEPVIHLEASGSGHASGGEQLSRSCAVTIRPNWTKLV